MVCELYLADSVAGLDKIAVENEVVRKIKDNKLDSMYKTADTCLKKIDSESSDEEKTYIFIKRFLYITDNIFLIEDDKKYFDLMLGKSIDKSKLRLRALRTNLEERYARHAEPKNVVTEVALSPPKKPKFFGTDAFVSCKEFYEAFIADPKMMLIMDIRSENDFNESHLKDFNIINISEEHVTPGLSAHLLGSKLDVSIQEIYEERDSFEYIILMDWDSTPKTFVSTKLHILRDMLIMWDINKNYKNPPLVLNGGYVEFIDMYPTLSTNSHVVYNQKYSELDELLDLEAIQYPSEDTTVTPYVEIKNDKQSLSVHDLLDQMLNVASKLLKIEEGLLNNQLKVFDLDIKMSGEDSQQDLTEKEILSEELSELETSKIIYDERKCILAKQIDTVQMTVRDEDNSWKIKKAQVDAIEAEICETALRRKQVNDDHDLYFGGNPRRKKGKAKGITSSGDSLEAASRPKLKPVINRSTKPTRPRNISNVESGTGLTGIVNIRNTCYMNTVIQCLRHLPAIKKFFCNGEYNKEVMKKEPVILFETAQLIKNLWLGTVRHVRPMEFYNKIGAINPIFLEGHHEDCSEFFMSLLNSLSDDCATLRPRQKYSIAKLGCWLYRLGYKTSFFIDAFYHQIRVTCICYLCKKKCEKYDIESTFMLSVPDSANFKLEDLMERYLSTQDMVPFSCVKCDIEIKQSKTISYQPRIAVIVLKRYKFDKGILQKKQNACNFPLDNFEIGTGTYKLWAIAMHRGTMQAGHYTAACLNPDGNWYEFNDQTVSTIAVDSLDVKKKVYMLFYELIPTSEKVFGFDNL